MKSFVTAIQSGPAFEAGPDFRFTGQAESRLPGESRPVGHVPGIFRHTRKSRVHFMGP